MLQKIYTKLVKKIVIIVLILVVLLGGFFILRPQKISINSIQISNMKLTSSAFVDMQKIPVKYTCHGDNAIPDLTISNIPAGTQSLVVILKDPDAPLETFIHWVVWNIPPVSSILGSSLPQGITEGQNSAGKNGYFSPCPPSGQHHYIFYLYALDTTLTLPQEAQAKDLEQVIVGHVLGATTLTGIFP